MDLLLPVCYRGRNAHLSKPPPLLCGRGSVLNRLDVVLAVLQVVEMFITAIMSGNLHDRTFNFAVVRGLRIARLVRLLRSVRIMHALSEIRSVVLSMIISFRPLLGALLILAFIMFIF